MVDHLYIGHNRNESVAQLLGLVRFMVSVLLNEFVIGVILLSECIELVID